MEITKEKIPFFLQFFFDKGENASQVAGIANGVYGADIVTANCVQFWFRRLHSWIFDVKDAPHTGRTVVKNVDKILEIIKIDPHIGSPSITQELKTDHKTVLSHLRKVGFKKKFHVWVPHQLAPKKHDGSNLHLQSLAKPNKIDSFLRKVTGDDNWAHVAILCENNRYQSAVKQLKRWPNQN
ncbi:histone-lysine N-methyltransferase SETMAR [Trichonephila clavipes]|nr:histone-lysine N-methyltransferase SETMAR [Trichonephila clavipes]